MGQFLPAEFSRGDANTLGGYMAVHARPAAFQASDGASYSVEIVIDREAGTGSSADAPVAGYLLFVRWSAGDPVAGGHVETDYLARGVEEDVLRKIGALSLQEVRELLESLVRASSASRPWWDAMRDESGA